jgi:hypothetical protein
LEKNQAKLAADAAKARGENGGEKMTEKTPSNKFLDSIAWGAFIVLLGAGWLAGSYYNLETGIYIALGVGIILIGLNGARSAMGIKISRFSLFIGALALALSGAGILGYSMPFIPTVVVLVGLFIVAEAFQKTINKKTVQA